VGVGWPTPTTDAPPTPYGRTPGLGARLFSWQRLGPHFAPEQEQDVWQSPLLAAPRSSQVAEQEQDSWQRLGPHYAPGQEQDS